LYLRMVITNKQLLKQLYAQTDRMSLAAILVELAERAENNPMLQEILRKIKLPPTFDTLEYIKPGNRKGYWARKPCWREHPTVNQREARLRFSKINYSLYGIKGIIVRPDGTRISQVNALAGELMKDAGRIASNGEREARKKRELIERIAQTQSSSSQLP
jgi:hypothetical protein